jgi:NTE family protein
MPERTALVLSAGGMFGAYQAGAWSVLSRLIRPSAVIGASIGSLNGWLIACGFSAGDLIDRWLHLEKAASHRFRLPRKGSVSLLDPQPFRETIEEIFSCGPPKIPFAAVATELPSCRPVLFSGREVTAQHLRASCAVPLFLPLERIGRHYYADGGLVDPLPLWAAVEWGATRIFAINVLNWRPLLIRALATAVRGICRCPKHTAPRVALLTIAPERKLGSFRDSMVWSPDNCRRWIEQGRRDAESALKHFEVECFERSGIGL